MMKAAELLKIAEACGISSNGGFDGQYVLVTTGKQLEEFAKTLLEPTANALLRYQLLELVKRDGLFSYELAEFMTNKGLATKIGTANGPEWNWKPDVLELMPLEQLVQLVNEMSEVREEQLRPRG